MWQAAIPILGKLAGKVFDRVLPDKVAQDKAKAEFQLALLAQDGEEMKTAMSAIIMEAQSADPWTSRARPSFMYVIYFMIIMSVPMGVLHAIDPEIAINIADGMKAWLEAIPEEMWYLFGAGYLGYGHYRSKDKKTVLGK